MAKQYIDWSDFTTGPEAVDLLSNSIRKGVDFDAYGDKRVFKAIVLSPTIQITDTEAKAFGAAFKQEISAVGRKFKFKARIVEENSPHSFIPNPCDLAKNDSTKNSAINPESLVAMHTDVIMFHDGHVSTPCMGDIVEIQLKKNDFSYDLTVARFVKVSARNAGQLSLSSEKGCETVARNFDTMPIYSGPQLTELAPSSGVSAFYNKLKRSTHFKNFSSAFLVGLVANAQAESALKSNAMGDPLSLYTKRLKEGKMTQRSYDDISARALGATGKQKCSFGYWQLNVCPPPGQSEGSNLLQKKGISPVTNPELALSTVVNEDNQFEYVANRMIEMFGGRVKSENDPYAAANDICTMFERPVNKQEKGKQRGQLASKIAQKVS